jgi:hypothetical protein
MTTGSLARAGISSIWPAAGKGIAISSIRLAEIVYLIEKARIPANVYSELNTVLADPRCGTGSARSYRPSDRRDGKSSLQTIG